MSITQVPGEQVSFYSGHSHAERPVAFTWNDKCYQVENVIAEWRTPDGKIFLVQTTDGQKFELIWKNDR